MDTTIQRERARTFQDRHTDTSAGPLVLPNSWDVASTIIYDAAGFDAVGTSSAGIAATFGVPDGEILFRDEMLAVVERIAHSVTIPVSADIEAGYGETIQNTAETVRRTIEAGAVGINLEDGTDSGLVETDHHVQRIRAARAAADEADIPLVINGRTDIFWRGVGAESERTERAIERANRYSAAGSDCLFVPGATDLSVIETLVDGIDGPLNVLGGPGAPPIPKLEELGVARVSVGSGPMRATLGTLQKISTEIHDEGTYSSMENAVPYDRLNAMLSASSGSREA